MDLEILSPIFKLILILIVLLLVITSEFMLCSGLQTDFSCCVHSNPEVVGHKAAWLCIILSWRTGKLSNQCSAPPVSCQLLGILWCHSIYFAPGENLNILPYMYFPFFVSNLGLWHHGNWNVRQWLVLLWKHRILVTVHNWILDTKYMLILADA
jgi:hypothetical protein